jgi:hypothetical protein
MGPSVAPPAQYPAPDAGGDAVPDAVQAGDRTTVVVDHLGVGVGLRPALGVERAARDERGVVRA